MLDLENQLIVNDQSRNLPLQEKDIPPPPTIPPPTENIPPPPPFTRVRLCPKRRRFLLNRFIYIIQLYNICPVYCKLM